MGFLPILYSNYRLKKRERPYRLANNSTSVEDRRWIRLENLKQANLCALPLAVFPSRLQFSGVQVDKIQWSSFDNSSGKPINCTRAQDATDLDPISRTTKCIRLAWKKRIRSIFKPYISRELSINLSEITASFQQSLSHKSLSYSGDQESESRPSSVKFRYAAMHKLVELGWLEKNAVSR
jgi:hypothetical protein